MTTKMGALRPVMLCAVASVLTAGPVLAQTAPAAAPVAAPVAAPAPVAQPAPVAAPAEVVRWIEIPEGTEVELRFDDKLSSGTNAQGDRFSVTLASDITLADGTVIPAGYKGAGEVTVAEKKGMMGKAGQLNVRFDYIRIGDTKVRLRGSKGQEGKSGVGATVALTVLFGPIGLIKKGHDVEIQKGQTIKAYADADAKVEFPLAAAPTA